VKPCYLEEFVSHVAAMLKSGATEEDIDEFLATIAPEYRAEIVAAARELVNNQKTGDL
jgi:alkylhydroperoxidase/carboxymuconolactone decarboxylase family protein YurZ